jgi:putative salt-induced outer membrane protein YdiY
VRRAVMLCGIWCVLAMAARADQVTLKNGDRISGTIVKSDAKTMLIKTDWAGELNVQLDAVDSITSAQALHLELKNGQTVSGIVSTEDGRINVATPAAGRMVAPRDQIVAIRNDSEQQAYDRLQHPGLREFWSGVFDTGLSLTRGNSSLLAYNLAAKMSRTVPKDKITAYTTVVYATDNTIPPGHTTANAVLGGARIDVNLKPRIFVFGLADFAYDQFQHLDLRSVFGGGFGVHVIKEKDTTLDVFAGADYDREAFSPNPPLVLTSITRNVAEVIAGEELSWRMNSRTSLDERFSAFPNMSDLGQYRFQVDATAATKLKNWLSWQISFSDRYLSNPLPGLKPNDEFLSTGLRVTFGQGKL